MTGVASFHLVRHRTVSSAVRTLAFDRVRLRRLPGLRFVRVLGTGAGASTGPGVAVRRTAVFAVWEDESAVAAALPQLHRGADEAWHAILVAIGGHGTWGGFDVLVASGGDTAPSEPVAVVTRAGVRVGAWRPFRRGSVAVDATLAGADGLLAVVGFGEAPVGRLGTFSVWRDLDAMGRWSRNPAHGDVVRRTRSERWYGEELFARFAIAGSAGTWDGRDPLASSGTSIP